MIKFDQELTEKDFSYFTNFSIFERKPFNKIFLLYISPILGISLLLFIYFSGDEANALFVVLCGFLIFLGWTMKVVFRLMSLSNYRRNPLLGARNRISFEENEIVTVSKQGTARNKYISVVKVYVMKDYIVAFFNNRQYLGIKTSTMSKEQRGEIIKTYKSKCLGRLDFRV